MTMLASARGAPPSTSPVRSFHLPDARRPRSKERRSVVGVDKHQSPALNGLRQGWNTAVDRTSVTRGDKVHSEGMTDDEKRALAKRSNELLESMRHLRDTEHQKRELPISTPEFHVVADEADKTSRRVFSLARDQTKLGEEIETQDESVGDVDRAASKDR